MISMSNSSPGPRVKFSDDGWSKSASTGLVVVTAVRLVSEASFAALSACALNRGPVAAHPDNRISAAVNPAAGKKKFGKQHSTFNIQPRTTKEMALVRTL